LDAYQEGLILLLELRKRIQDLQKKEVSIDSELQNLEMFLSRLHESAEKLDIIARRKILQLVVKEILVGPDNLTIRHSIPTSGYSGGHSEPSYLLCKGSTKSPSCQYLPSLLPGCMV